jgi:hypothetical protein
MIGALYGRMMRPLARVCAGAGVDVLVDLIYYLTLLTFFHEVCLYWVSLYRIALRRYPRLGLSNPTYKILRDDQIIDSDQIQWAAVVDILFRNSITV